MATTYDDYLNKVLNITFQRFESFVNKFTIIATLITNDNGTKSFHDSYIYKQSDL